VKFRSFWSKQSTLAKKNLSYLTLISANAEEYLCKKCFPLDTFQLTWCFHQTWFSPSLFLDASSHYRMIPGPYLLRLDFYTTEKMFFFLNISTVICLDENILKNHLIGIKLTVIIQAIFKANRTPVLFYIQISKIYIRPSQAYCLRSPIDEFWEKKNRDA
jgi:hypothetical protein